MTTQSPQCPQGKCLLMAGLFVFVVAVGFYVLNAPDRRDAGQKVSDAIHELPNLDKAERQLKDRTPGEKLHDAAKDAGDNIKKSTNQQ